MRHLLLTATFLTATPAFAGGPVVIEERYNTEIEASPKANWVAPVVIGLVLVCAIACGNDKDAPAPAAPPPPPCNGGC